MTSYGSPLFNMSDQYAEGRLEYMVCNSDRKDVSYGPVDKSKNSAEPRSGPGIIGNLEIEKDGIYHPLKV